MKQNITEDEATAKFNEMFAPIKETVHKILDHEERVCPLEIDSRFSMVEALCKSEYPKTRDRLEAEVRKILERHILEISQSIVHVGIEDPPDQLNRFYTNWQQFTCSLELLNILMAPLHDFDDALPKTTTTTNKTTTLNEAATAPTGWCHQRFTIKQLTLMNYRWVVVEWLSPMLVHKILAIIQHDRFAERPRYATAVQQIVGIFVEVGANPDINHDGNEQSGTDVLDVYVRLFENNLIVQSRHYYAMQAMKWRQQCNVSQYMKNVLRLIEMERERAQHSFHPSTVNKLAAQCTAQCVQAHLNYLNVQCYNMVYDENTKDLRNLYQLLYPIPHADELLLQTAYAYYRNEFVQIIVVTHEQNMFKHFVDDMHYFSKTFGEQVIEAYSADARFIDAAQRAYSDALNVKPEAATMLAKYCDFLLKSSGFTDSQVEVQCIKTIDILRLVRNKDEFRSLYSTLMMNRLQTKESRSVPGEKIFIESLQEAFGVDFTSDLCRLYLSAVVAERLQPIIKIFSNEHSFSAANDPDAAEDNFELKVNIEESPSSEPSSFAAVAIGIFPELLQTYCGGQPMTWICENNQGKTSALFVDRPYKIGAQSFQMATLLQFEPTNVRRRDNWESLRYSHENLHEKLYELAMSKFVMASRPLSDDYAVCLDFSTSAPPANSPQIDVDAIVRELMQRIRSIHFTKPNSNSKITKE